MSLMILKIESVESIHCHNAPIVAWSFRLQATKKVIDC
jgi:hypothetical protein